MAVPCTICARQQEKWNVHLRNNIAAPKKYFLAKFNAESDRIVGPILRAMFIFPRRPRRSAQPPLVVRGARVPRSVLTSTENLPQRPKRIVNRPSRYLTGEASFKDTLKTTKKSTSTESANGCSPETSSIKSVPNKPPPVTPVEAEEIQIQVLAIASKTSQNPQQCAFELSSSEERLDDPVSQSRLI